MTLLRPAAPKAPSSTSTAGTTSSAPVWKPSTPRWPAPPSDGTVTTLKDGTEIHWVINPNQDGVYQQKLDEALLNQAIRPPTDDKVDIFLSETDYVYKYTDADADVAMPLTDLGIDPDTDLADQYPFTRDHRLRPERRPARLHLAVLPGPSGLPAGYCEGRLRYR